MNSNWIFIAYYAFVLAIMSLCVYVVFILGNSPWWFLAAYLICENAPSVTQKKDKNE